MRRDVSSAPALLLCRPPQPHARALSASFPGRVGTPPLSPGAGWQAAA